MSDATSAPIFPMIDSTAISAAHAALLFVVLLLPLEGALEVDARAPAETASAVSPSASLAEPSCQKTWHIPHVQQVQYES
jgi:hypothetical protein